MKIEGSPRILFLVPSDYSQLADKGVEFLMADREEGGFFDRVITVHPWAGRTQVIDLSPVHRLYEIKEYFLPLCDRIKILRYPHHLFHFVRVVSKILHIIDAEHIHLIRATDPVYTGFLARVVTLFRTVPYCVSVHADYDKRFELDPSAGAPTLLGSRRLAKAVEKYVLSHADLVMPIRASLAQKLIDNGVPSTQIRIIPHGIDLTSFANNSGIDVRQSLSIPPVTPILSFAGRLSRENYIYDVLDLARDLKKTRSDFVVVIAGDGPERKEVEQRVFDYHLQGHVKILGYKPHDFIVSLRKASAVSLCLMGGFSLIEACAAGRPVIAYDVEWHSELIQTKETGWLVKEHDAAALREAVLFFLTHPSEADRIGGNARRLAFDRHSRQKTSSLRVQCYQELLSPPAFSRP